MIASRAASSLGDKENNFTSPGLIFKYSFISSIGFSVFYRIFEQFDSLFPNIGEKPLLAAVVGALFVGISVGLCVRVGGARQEMMRLQ